MSDDPSTRRLRESRRSALGDLDKVRSMLRRRQIVLALLFNDMRAALNWAVECWLEHRGARGGASWTNQEAEFLRLAPESLQDEYLRVAGEVVRLACDLYDQTGSSDVREIASDAPSLAPWLGKATDWTREAAALVEAMIEAPASQPVPAGHRVERGILQGRLDGLVPCLVLAQFGGGAGRWRDGDGRAGLFDFGERGGLVNRGLVLPLALCREPDLRDKLTAFAALVETPGRSHERHRGLQDWLDANGLGILRLAEGASARRWTRFLPNRAVYAEILRHFDHVTAVADDPGRPCRILAQAPFRWVSHADVLDWSMGEDQTMAILPFHLSLATEITGFSDPLRSSREGDSLFRPLSYWEPWTRPAATLSRAAVAVRLTQGERDYGWIDLDITLGELTAQVTLSDAFDPLPTLLDWLQGVADGDLPVGMTIDEEGSEARLIAHRFDEGRLLVAVLDRWAEKERASAVVEGQAFLDAFRAELHRFLGAELRLERWKLNSEDDGYLDRLRGHPFIA